MEINTSKQRELYKLIEPKIIDVLKGRQITLENAVYLPGARKGEAILGKILQIIVLGKCGEMQTHVHLVVKFAVENFLREQLPIEVAYAREIFMYEKVFPIFMNFRSKFSQKFMEFPQYFASNPEATPEYIIMNDMKCEGYKTVADRTVPLNLDHMLLAVRAYAQLHALSLAVSEKDGKKYTEWETKLQANFYSSMKNTNINFIKTHCERALKTLDPEKHQEVLAKFKNLDSSIFEKMKAATTQNEAGDFKVICHGDCSITNIMFKYETRENLKPTAVGLVDFQMSKVGSPALDLSHLLFLCTSKKLRDQHYQTLLKNYCDNLSSFCKELNVEVQFSLEALQDHMKRFSIYGLYMAVTNLYLKMSCDEEIPSVDDFRDMSDAEEKVGHRCFKKEAFENRIRNVLIDFHNYGYIV